MKLTLRVRAAIAQCPAEFTATQVASVLGADRDEIGSISNVLRNLEVQGELDAEQVFTHINGAGGNRRKVFRRTKSFRAEEFNPLALSEGGRLVNELICSWTARRHAQAR